MEAGDEPLHRVAGHDAGAVRGRRHRGTCGLDVVGERDRRAVGRPGKRLGWPDGDQDPAASRRRDLGRLECDRPVAAGALGRPEPLVEVLHRGLGMERDHRVLQLVGAEPGHDVRRDEHQRVTDRDLAAPDLGFQAAGRQAALAMRVGQGREAGLADEVGLGRPDRRHVHLVATHDTDADADRPVLARDLQAETVGLVEQALVGRGDRLLEADADPRRLVVVILVADRLGREARGLERMARARARRHQQVQVALRPGDRADARLDDHEGVGRVVEAVVLGDDP